MSSAVPIAVFASGRGSNFAAIADAMRAGQLDARVTMLISDRADAPALERARERGIAAQAILPEPSRRAEPGKSPGKPEDVSARRTRHEARVLEALAKDPPRFLVLAGYMRVLTESLIERFRSDRGKYTRIVNIHPSLLPAFPGTHGYAQAYRYGTKVAGSTVHLVEREVDAGPILAQESFPIHDCASAEAVEARGLAVENRLYPETLRWVLPEHFTCIEGEGRVRVRPH